MRHPPPVVEIWDGINVVRDDFIQGGTKSRVLPLLFDEHEEYVYAGPCQGYAQVALAHCAAEYGKRATLFCAKRNVPHARTMEAAEAGATIHQIPCGYLTVVRSYAEKYCQATGAVLLPFGLDTQIIRDALANVARSILRPEPTEVWTVAGSGLLSTALQQAWPNAEFHAVLVGRKMNKVGRAKIWVASEKFEQDAKEPPPFASCTNYDAKAWRFIRQHARPGAWFWNVAS